MPPLPPDPAPQVHLTALELHPDGQRLRLTLTRYRGSALYGPALAGAVPGATPVRRLEGKVLPDRDNVPQRRAVWLMRGDADSDGWLAPDALPADAQVWVRRALSPDPEGRPHWQRRGGWGSLMTWLHTELAAQGLKRLDVPQVMRTGESVFWRVFRRKVALSTSRRCRTSSGPRWP